MEWNSMIRLNFQAPKFEADVFHNNEIRKVKLEDFKGKWVVLFFYPADFTFICPTELGDLADNYKKFKELGVEVLSVSTDTAFVHKAWWDSSDSIKKIKFPMVADPTGKISEAYGTYIPEEGVSLRGTFIIDPDGILKSFEISDNSVGRSTKELMRKIYAAQYVRKYDGKVCPANWEPGDPVLTPGLELVGKL